MAVSLSTYDSVILDGFTHGDKYHFYDSNKNPYPPSYYQYLLSTAKKSIKIWDPYWSDPTQLFSNVKQNNIQIDFVCSIGLENVKIMSDIADRKAKQIIRADIDKLSNILVKQGVTGFKINVHNYVCYKNKPQLWHDRYLILDDSEVYIVGASINMLTERNRSYGIVKVENKEDIDIVLNFNKYYREECRSKNEYPYCGVNISK